MSLKHINDAINENRNTFSQFQNPGQYILTIKFFNQNLWTPVKMSYNYVQKSPINIPAFVLIMASCHPGNKP